MMEDFYVSDDELHVPFLPRLSPRCITISRRYILDLALKRLGLTIESTEVTDAGDGELYASISLHLSADKGRHGSEPKMFHGDYAGTEEMAIESAISTALTFLKDKSMIYVDDANYHELKACQYKLLAASSWAMLFEDHATGLKRKWPTMSIETENDDKEIDIPSDCQDINSTYPLALNAGESKDHKSISKSQSHSTEIPCSLVQEGTTSQQMTPPPKLDMTSKRAGKQVVCGARRDLFGKRKRDHAK